MLKRRSVFFVIFLVCNSACAQKQVTDVQFKSVLSAEVDSIRTLQSVQKVDRLYMMTYYGDYDRRLERVNHHIIHRGFESVRTPGENQIECSMFAAFGSTPLYGRNFDNPDCGVLVTLCRPTDGYVSVGFSRINDLGFDTGEDPREASDARKMLLLNAPFFTPDGMNECGVVTALAALPGVRISIGQDKKPMFITCLVREILDHAGNIDEAIAIIKRYNVFDSSPDIVSHHLLISDPTGRSVIVENTDGEWKVMSNNENWQTITNTPLYGRSETSRKNDCWRYKILFEGLTEKEGKVSWEEGMGLLERVSGRGTQWSTICNLKSKDIYISLYRDFNLIQRIRFD